ncbi:hypothetical protein [Azospirillum formosense]|uniref:hypothetical protein n=1 Tax=Azospirillum formosense TaxID=861533 RepID=UPI00338F7648
MNAETGSEPEAPKKRGRIPQSAWPQILERYRSGVTLSAIAREFECTPSAISYIIRKAEAASEKDAPVEDGAVTDDVAEAPAGDAMAEEPPPAPAPEAVPEAPAPVKPARRAAAPAPAPAAQTAAPAAAPAAVQAATSQPAPAQPSAPVQTETLRLNRPESQPAPQPAPVQPAAAPAQAAAQPATAAATTDANRPAGTNPPPVDAVEARLRDTARGCLNAYRGWRQQPGEASIQTLSEAVHELRKALARIEIDMSASRREEQAIRPIPIPAHRTARRTP